MWAGMGSGSGVLPTRTFWCLRPGFRMVVLGSDLKVKSAIVLMIR
jgi:hypothetical protein